MASSTQMRWPLVGFVLAHVRARGGDADALARQFALGDDDVAVLPLARFRAFIDAAADAARDPALGVHIAEALPRGPLGLLEFAATTAATLGDGLRRVGRYAALVNDAVEVALVDAGDEARLEQRLAGEPGVFGRQTNEFFVSYVLLQARRATGDACVPSRVWLAHPRPRDLEALVAAVGTDRIDFDSDENGFALPRALLELPLARADASLSRWLDAEADRALGDHVATPSLQSRVRAAIRARLASGSANVAAVARAVGTSARTLQRRLAAEATSFAALLDAVRADVALAHVRDGRRTLSEISYLCGYSEPSAFLRAFKRWTGRTPSGFSADEARRASESRPRA